MPESLARYYARYMPLKILPLPIQAESIPMQIQWHRYKDHDPGTKWFLKMMKDCANAVYPANAKAYDDERSREIPPFSEKLGAR